MPPIDYAVFLRDLGGYAIAAIFGYVAVYFYREVLAVRKERDDTVAERNDIILDLVEKQTAIHTRMLEFLVRAEPILKAWEVAQSRKDHQ